MHRPRRHRHYVLDERKNARPATMLEYAQMTDGLGSRVAETDLELCRVSTVFLGLDLRPVGEGPPILFETMVFPADEGLTELSGRRYCTWGEAEVGHMEIVEALREEIAQLRRRAEAVAADVLDQAAARKTAPDSGPGR